MLSSHSTVVGPISPWLVRRQQPHLHVSCVAGTFLLLFSSSPLLHHGLRDTLILFSIINPPKLPFFFTLFLLPFSLSPMVPLFSPCPLTPTPSFPSQGDANFELRLYLRTVFFFFVFIMNWVFFNMLHAGGLDCFRVKDQVMKMVAAKTVMMTSQSPTILNATPVLK